MYNLKLTKHLIPCSHGLKNLGCGTGLFKTGELHICSYLPPLPLPFEKCLLSDKSHRTKNLKNKSNNLICDVHKFL